MKTNIELTAFKVESIRAAVNTKDGIAVSLLSQAKPKDAKARFLKEGITVLLSRDSYLYLCPCIGDTVKLTLEITDDEN
jgi:hypothetical protein